MRTFYEQFFEVYDIITKLYLDLQHNSTFCYDITICNFRNMKNNEFIKYTSPFLHFNFFIGGFSMDIDSEEIEISTQTKLNNTIQLYNYVNKVKLNMDDMKEAYDKYIANEVCNKLKSS